MPPSAVSLNLADNETSCCSSGRVVRTDGCTPAGFTIIPAGCQNALFATDVTGNYSFPGLPGGLNNTVAATAVPLGPQLPGDQ